jgi:hypothetical protein
MPVSCYAEKMRKSNPARPLRPNLSRAGGFTLGRDRFAQISAVEGIALTQEMRATLDRFDREGLSAEERRRAIVRRFAPTG